MNAKPATLRNVNAALAARGIPYKLHRVNGYHYVTGDGAEKWPSTSVDVFRTASLTIGGWCDEVARLRAEGAAS